MKYLFICLQITPKVPEDVYRTCQFDILFANEATAYTDIIPALGHVENFPKYYENLCLVYLAKFSH